MKFLALMKKHKKWLIVGGLGFAFTSFVGLIGLFYLAWTLTSSMVFSAVHQATSAVDAKRGFIEEMVGGVTVDWIEESLAQNESREVVDGLVCMAAIGGTRPEDVIHYTRSRLIDPAAAAKLDEIASRLQAVRVSGPAACASYLFSG